MKQLAIAYWLIPVEPARSFFQGIINDLARRHDAPVFEPHVTIHVGSNHIEMAKKALSRAARDFKQISLKTGQIDHSGQFTKTLFVQLALTTQLSRLNRIIRITAQDSSDYRVNPHVSLLYKAMSAQDRHRLTHSIEVPFSEAAFDSLKAVQCISPTRTRADVETWRVVAEKDLST